MFNLLLYQVKHASMLNLDVLKTNSDEKYLAQDREQTNFEQHPRRVSNNGSRNHIIGKKKRAKEYHGDNRGINEEGNYQQSRFSSLTALDPVSLNRSNVAEHVRKLSIERTLSDEEFDGDISENHGRGDDSRSNGDSNYGEYSDDVATESTDDAQRTLTSNPDQERKTRTTRSKRHSSKSKVSLSLAVTPDNIEDLLRCIEDEEFNYLTKVVGKKRDFKKQERTRKLVRASLIALMIVIFIGLLTAMLLYFLL